MSRNGGGFDDLFGGAGYDDDRDDRRVGGRAERHRTAATSGPGRRRQDRAGYADPGYDEAAYGEAGYGASSHASDDPDSDGYDPAPAGYDPVYADDAGYDGDSAYADDGGYGGGGYGDDGGAGRRGGRGHPEASGGRRPARALPKLIGVLVVVAALLGAGIFGIGKVIGRVGGEPAADYSGIGEGIVVVQIPAGATSSDIGTALAKADVVASGRAFVNVATRDSRALSIQPGTYRLRSKMSAASALDALLDDASSALFRYTISPGDTVRRVLQALSARTGTPLAELEALVRDPSSLGLPDYAGGKLEGYLFPSTYDVAPDTDPVDVLKEAVARFSAYADEHDIAGRARALGREPGAIVIVASIIEKEVANESEGPKVARVIYNRLADDSGRFRRLDMDSTTRYAANEHEGPLTREQLDNDDPYNTRAVPGLPPGAIASPSPWALESALNPADGPWFYFVSMPQTRETVFAANQAEFDVAMAEYHRQGGSE
ncbi:aminodeoxychorismate lyase [Parafrankia colletiae]|uniref:Endolytic murein transglycosylase n=1 Tax=Parafrankia colletiae TaxID=573497 RepID=A0A1S1R622_9ACTN|nr:endolytic transglycosylase MltG [Parafrankia colletiae]MCK9903489.1 endolytic transglycosylase MltG [Frankia sp. Cpl3]OHV41181.1 aminodeoxychorismate lyase [Parafrankia colletiae]